MEPFCSSEAPPYPVDDAAVHHVFDGGWVWGLRFNNGVTSAGIAATDKLANELCFAEGAPAWKRLLQRLPTLHEQFADAGAGFPFVHAPGLSFRTGQVAGPHWALLPSAAGFVDPLLSTGFPLTLLGINRLAQILENGLDSTRSEKRLMDYSRQTLKELDSTAQLVAALYATMDDFPLFAALSLLYFAAASFTETARRLNKAQLAGDTFLLVDHPEFGGHARTCCDAALDLKRRNGVTDAEKEQIVERIYRTIASVDVAGLSKRERRNWHPVNAADLFEAAPKLQSNASEIEKMLERCGFRMR
jgi:FADH2 O2-dependent halogenase